MKFISKEKIDRGHCIITVEEGLFFKKQIKYQSIDGRPFPSMKEWIRLPDQKRIIDILFTRQLETWEDLN